MAETIQGDRDWRRFFDAVSDRAEPNDLFTQVGRTIEGRPVGDEQISLTVDAARTALDLQPSDCLLDLCCGNGLVTEPLARICAQTVAVDFGLDLLEVARSRRPAPGLEYIHCPVADLTAGHLRGRRPTKVAMIAAAQHFTVDAFNEVVATVGRLIEHSAPFYLDDVPDVDCLLRFYDTPERQADYQQRKAAGTEAIGTWWNRQHLVRIFAAQGYRVQIFDQDPRRSGAHYRFALLAEPVPS